jgi:hypothetical protein
MSAPSRSDVGTALRGTLISPNESDANLEAANVAAGLFAIARAIDHLAEAVTAAAETSRRPRAPRIPADPPARPTTDWR